MTNTKVLLSTTPRQVCAEQSSNNCSLLSSQYQHNYIAPKTTDFLEKEKYLSEFNTDNKKFKARQNLGINGLAYWGNIQGHIEDQQDLYQFLQEQIKTPLENQFVTIQTTISEQIEQLQNDINNEIKSTLKTKIGVELGEEYEQGKASTQLKHGLVEFDNLNAYKLGCEGFAELFDRVLNSEGREDVSVSSINDVLKLLVNKVFPIEWKNWTLSSSGNINLIKTYEKGTTLTLAGNTSVGTITVTATPGNTGTPATLTANNQSKEDTKAITIIIDVKVKDIVGGDFRTTTTEVKKKTYEYTLNDNGKITQGSNTASITPKYEQYYFYIFDDSMITDSDIKYSDIDKLGKSVFKTTKSENTINVGNSDKYITILSPKKITNIEVGTSVDGSSFTSYKYEKWDQNQIQYTPNNGTNVDYWRINFQIAYPNHLKIKLT